MEMIKERSRLEDFLNAKVKTYNVPGFIKDDPVSIPHRFSLAQDIEISGFFAAILAWGNRTTIINKSRELMQLMDDAPYQFVVQHKENDLKRLLGFKHRTFNSTDLLYFIEFFKCHYSAHHSLESAFSRWMNPEDENIENALDGFYTYFFSLPDAPPRTRKHIAAPFKHSGCKRLNMFLRWMVRKDNMGVDLGLWKKIRPAQLICPIDLHVARVAKRFNLSSARNPNWQAAIDLTNQLRKFDPLDPVKYDFALFGLGVVEKF